MEREQSQTLVLLKGRSISIVSRPTGQRLPSSLAEVFLERKLHRCPAHQTLTCSASEASAHLPSGRRGDSDSSAGFRPQDCGCLLSASTPTSDGHATLTSELQPPPPPPTAGPLSSLPFIRKVNSIFSFLKLKISYTLSLLPVLNF